MKKRDRFDLLRGEHGASLVELALLMPLFFVLMALAVDLGRAYYLVLEIQGAAQAGAAYGVTNPTDTAGMKTAATDDAPNVPNLTVNTPTYGCECSDGTGYVANCPSASQPTCSGTTLVYLVKVTVTATYTTMFPWPKLNNMTFSSSASMRSAGS